MRVFLTGGTGFIGRPLARRMVERGWDVHALVRKPDGTPARDLAALGVQLVPGDVTERASMAAGMQGADLVVHNAAWYELGVSAAARAAMQRINVDGTENVLGLAHELKIPRTVHVSSVVAYAESGSTLCDESHPRHAPYRTHYAKTKAEAHDIAEKYQQRGQPLVIASPGVVIGPNDHAVWGHFARLYVNGWLPPMAWGKDTVAAQATAEDTAEGIALAAEKGKLGESYFVCGDLANTGEIVGLWGETPGGMRVRMWMPPGLMSFMFAPLEPLQRKLGISAFLSRESVSVGMQDFRFSNAKAKRDLGWVPQPPLDAWRDIMAAERELKKQRRGGGIAARLSPLDI